MAVAQAGWNPSATSANTRVGAVRRTHWNRDLECVWGMGRTQGRRGLATPSGMVHSERRSVGSIRLDP